MKSLLLAIAVLVTLSFQLNAQTGTPMDVTFTRLSETGNEYTLEVSIDLTETLQDGLALELPGKIRAIPVAVEVNGTSLWLKQSGEPPVAASTLTWFRDDSGRVVLHFTENRLAAGDRLLVRCTASMKERPGPNENLALKRLAREGALVKASDEVMSSKGLPVVEKTN